MGEFNKYVKGGRAHLKPFTGSWAKQLNHHTIPILDDHQYDKAATHVGINSLFKKKKEYDWCPSIYYWWKIKR